MTDNKIKPIGISLYTWLTIFALLIGPEAMAAQRSQRVAQFKARTGPRSSRTLHMGRNTQPVGGTRQAARREDNPEANFKRFELRTAPIALLASWYTLDASIRLDENWATGPAVIFYDAGEQGNMLSPSYKGQALGWHANYYFDSIARSTWYLSAHAYHERYNSYPHGSGTSHYEIEGFKANSAIGFARKLYGAVMMVGIGQEYRQYQVVRNNRTGPTRRDEYPENRWLFYPEFKIGVEF